MTQFTDRELTFMALQYACEEWLAGRITDDDLRETAGPIIERLTEEAEAPP